MENKFIERDMEEEIEKWLFAREIIAIRGPRQCGKTTLLKKVEKKLVSKGIKKENITFATFEDDIEKEKFEKNPLEYIKYFIEEDSKKTYFLLDEIQYVKNAGKLLKLIYDSLDNVKIFITGSSSLELTDIGSYLVGRVLFFELRHFSFSEFLRAKDKKSYQYYGENKFEFKKLSEGIFLDKLNELLEEYLTYGGYPRIILENDEDKKKFLLKNLFLTYIEKDIVKLYGLKYKDKISVLIKFLASSNGEMINYNETCKITGFYLKELKEILKILEDTYVIKVVKPFHKNMVTEIKKNPRIYFLDIGIRNFINNQFKFSDKEKGKIFENFVLNSFSDKKPNYWRTTSKAEVDFIFSDSFKNFFPVEVKTHPKITKAFRSFINEYQPEYAIVANLDKSEYKGKIGKTKIYFVPFSLL